MTVGPSYEQAIVQYTDLVGDCRVRIEGPSGSLCELAVDLADDVSTLKKQVLVKTGIPELQQQLSVGAGDLHNRDLLGAFVVPCGTVSMQLRLRSPEQAEWLGRLRNDAEKKSKVLCLNEAPEDLLADAEFMCAAVQEHRLALRFAAQELKADKAVVRAAVRLNGRALGLATDPLRDDDELALLAVLQDGWALELVSERLQDNADVVLAAVQQTGAALEFAGPAARANRAIVLEAVRGHGMSLVQAAPELQVDRELALAAVQEDWEVIKYLPPTIRGDRRVALAAVKTHHPRAAKQEYGEALKHVGADLRSDRRFCLEAVKAVGRAFSYLPPQFKGDRDIALAAVKQDGTALTCMSSELQDAEIAVAAVRQNRQALYYVHSDLKGAVAKALKDASLQDSSVPPPRPELELPRMPDPKLRKHFKTLGLTETATAQDVRRRFRELALQTHPDKQRGGDSRKLKASKDRFIAISQAYQAVRDQALGG